MKKIITGLLILFFGIQVNAQIKTNKLGMVGEPYFKIKCKADDEWLKHDIMELLFTSGDEESASVFKMADRPNDDTGFTKKTYTYKSEKILAKKVWLQLKVLSSVNNLATGKDGFLRLDQKKLGDAADPEIKTVFLHVDLCKDGEHVRFYNAKREAHMNKEGTLDHYTLTDIKYMTLVDTPEGKRITFKKNPEGDNSMWKLFRVQ